MNLSKWYVEIDVDSTGTPAPRCQIVARLGRTREISEGSMENLQETNGNPMVFDRFGQSRSSH